MIECKKDMLCVEIFRLFLHVIYVKLITSRKPNSHRNDWRENYMTIEMKMDQKYEQGREIAEIAEDLDQSEEYVKSLICSQE